MLQTQCHHLLSPNLHIPPLPLTHHKPFLSLPSPPPSPLLRKPTTTLHSVLVSAIPPATSSWAWLTHLAELTTSMDIETEGPIELPFSSTPSIFATTDDPSPIQVASSILLTGAISVLLFRSLRRRAKRAKESDNMPLRGSGSSGEKKSVKEEALDSLKALGSASIDVAKGPPSPVQAFLGGISAGIIALIFYKFRPESVEGKEKAEQLAHGPMVWKRYSRRLKENRQLVTECWAEVFPKKHSSGPSDYNHHKLAMKSLMGDSTEKETESKSTDQSSLSNSSVESPTNNTELSSRKEEQSSNDTP
ncbi:hypothetical protein SESBI_12599 [Sesbania bispinosa]|nr:hypothetical protein SESBI_12599 [Sesbania bispinosa]